MTAILKQYTDIVFMALFIIQMKTENLDVMQTEWLAAIAVQ